MSFAAQFVRNRQSCHATKILPAPSISADGSGPLRRLPAGVWLEIEVIVNAWPKLEPPLVELVNGSTAICVRATFAEAVTASASAATATSPKKREKRLRRGNERDCML